MPILCAILAGLCWGVGEIFTKSALNSRDVGPMTAAFIRAAVTLPLALAAMLAAPALLKSEPTGGLKALSTLTWLKLIGGSGLLAGFAGVFFFYFGLSLPGGDISLLRPIAFGLAPATAFFLGWIFLGEAISLQKVVAVLLIVAGIALLGLSHDPAKSSAAAHPKPTQTT